MEIKCNNYPIYSLTYLPKERLQLYPAAYGARMPRRVKGKINLTEIRPVASTNATGLNAFTRGLISVYNSISSYAVNYKKNIKHTYEHKIIFSLIEKQLYGHNSIDSLTHDADKMILYMLGFPRSFVSKFHRKHSAHHIESGKTPNLRSMFVDNIASSPEFKPDKKLSLRAYYNSSEELQNLEGFAELLKKYNFGENLDFAQIKRLKEMKFNGTKGVARIMMKALTLFLIH
ncbi:hypothetical protein IJ541_04225 [bacterium]|nr:hypothetical protein [bacterium]